MYSKIYIVNDNTSKTRQDTPRSHINGIHQYLNNQLLTYWQLINYTVEQHNKRKISLVL